MNEIGYAGDWTDRQALAEQLAAIGLSPAACHAKAQRFALAAAALSATAGHHSAKGCRGYFVPGRIEVLGKHTDYAGGSSLVAAAERGLCLLVRPRADRTVRMIDAAGRDEMTCLLDGELTPCVGHWSNYPMTVVRRLARNFPGLQRGADIAFASDLPPAAGMSSSSALIVAVFLALADANHLSQRPDFPQEFALPYVLAGYLGTIENGQSFGALAGDRGVGTFGGSEDHTAILCAEPGRLSQYAYCPVRFERTIPLPTGYVFAIGSSGVVAEKTSAAREKYNRASQLAAAVAELWRRETGRDDPHLAAILHHEPQAAARLEEMLLYAGDLGARLRQFIVENEEVLPAAGDALAAGDLPKFGDLVDRSQQAAEQWLGNQVPETVFLAAAARQQGAAAASAFGAGFGGSVWALVQQSQAESFLTAWAAAYRQEFPDRAAQAEFFLTAAGPSATRIVPQGGQL